MIIPNPLANRERPFPSFLGEEVEAQAQCMVEAGFVPVWLRHQSLIISVALKSRKVRCPALSPH